MWKSVLHSHFCGWHPPDCPVSAAVTSPQTTLSFTDYTRFQLPWWSWGHQPDTLCDARHFSRWVDWGWEWYGLVERCKNTICILLYEGPHNQCDRSKTKQENLPNINNQRCGQRFAFTDVHLRITPQGRFHYSFTIIIVIIIIRMLNDWICLAMAYLSSSYILHFTVSWR